MVFDMLFGQDSNFNITPQMVEGVLTENDGRRWTLTLRDDLTFHDGEPVLAPAHAVHIRCRFADWPSDGRRFANAGCASRRSFAAGSSDYSRADPTPKPNQLRRISRSVLDDLRLQLSADWI